MVYGIEQLFEHYTPNRTILHLDATSSMTTASVVSASATSNGLMSETAHPISGASTSVGVASRENLPRGSFNKGRVRTTMRGKHALDVADYDVDFKCVGIAQGPWLDLSTLSHILLDLRGLYLPFVTRTADGRETALQTDQRDRQHFVVVKAINTTLGRCQYLG